MKKLTSYLITVMMVFTMIPYTAFAASDRDVQNVEKKMFYMEMPDPIDSDSSLNAEVVEITPFSAGEDTAALSDIDYATTIEGAASVLREGMVNRQNEIEVGYRMDEWTDEAFSNAVNAILNEAEKHTGAPAEGDFLRWVKGSGSMSGSAWSDGTYYYTTIVYSLTYYTTAEQEKELDAAVDALLSEIIADDMTDYAKVKAIYDYMTANISYDYTNLNDENYKLKYTAYAALINKTSVCQGYATLFYRLALECGIDARLISGEATNSLGQTEGHGWNIVKLGGKYYLTDATWDTSRVNAGVPYDYFLKASYSDHIADNEYKTAPFTTNHPMATEDYVACTEHIPEVIPAVEPTCKTTGWTEGSKCSNCGEILVARQFIPEKDHTFSGAWWSNSFTHWKTCSCGAKGEEAEHILTTTTVDPTCEEMGWKIQTCTVCGNESSSSIPALGHDYVDASVDPTCTEEGCIGDVCTRCGDRNFYGYPGPLGHKAKKTTVRATKDKAGFITSECTTCGEQLSKTTIAKIGKTTISKTKYVYSGKAVKPVITVKNVNGKELVKGTDYTVTYKNANGTKAVTPKAVGKYKAVVTFKGKYEGTVTKYFTINPKGVGPVKLTKNGKKQFTAKWTKRTAQVTGYEVKYGLKGKAAIKTVKVKNFRTNTKTIKNLKSNKNYWVQVRSYKMVNGVKYNSAWTVKNFIKTK